MNINTSLIAGLTLVVVGLLFGMAGLVDIEPGEVGLKIKKIGDNKGMQSDTLDTGWYWINPLTYDTAVYDTRKRQYTLTDVASTTKDGQPVLVDLSLEIGLLDPNVPVLHETIGKNWFDQVVYPATRSAIRNNTSKQMSDEIYTGKGRANVQGAIQTVLGENMSVRGIVVDVNLRDISFTNSTFIATLEEKAAAAQRVLIEERKAEAAKHQAKKMENLAEGEKQKRVKAAEAKAEEMRQEGIGRRAQKEQDARGILAIAKAEAEGVKLRRQALSGAGGAELVSIEWAKNLGPNVKVYGIPTGSPGTTSVMDLNGLVSGAFKGISP